MNLNARLKRIERRHPELSRPPRGSSDEDRELVQLAQLQLQASPQWRQVSAKQVTAEEYAAIQHTIALAEQRWSDVERWQAEENRYRPKGRQVNDLWERRRWLRRQVVKEHLRRWREEGDCRCPSCVPQDERR